MPLSRAFFFGILAWSIACGADRTAAQTDLAPELLNRPPVAAPTSRIETGAIPVVLSESQEIDNFTTGLLQGLMAGNRVKGIALVVVKDDHVMLQRNVGAVGPDTSFAAGALSQMFGAVAAMQQVERGRLILEADIAKALGETAPRGMTLGQVLSFQAGNPSLTISAVEKASGAKWADTLAKEIAQPLGMTATAMRGDMLQTSVADMSHFAIALVNGGAFQNGRILAQATAEQMESNHFTPHPVLPGSAYGFTEFHRHGRRALQDDGAGDDFASRLVIVPEAKLGYFIVAEGHTSPEFWRALDNGLFDRLLPSHNTPNAGASGGPSPTQADAERVAGRYEPSGSVAAQAAALRFGTRLTVAAGAGARLILTGAETATLAPQPGGYWGTADGNLKAAARNGEFVLSDGTYAPLALYKRAESYAWMGLLVALVAGGFVAYERRRRPEARFPSDAALSLASASVVLFLFSVIVWLFAPGA